MKRIELYYEILKRIKIRNETITAVAKKLGFTRQNLKRAVLQNWTGPKSQQAVKDVCEYVGLKPPSVKKVRKKTIK